MYIEHKVQICQAFFVCVFFKDFFSIVVQLYFVCLQSKSHILLVIRMDGRHYAYPRSILKFYSHLFSKTIS